MRRRERDAKEDSVRNNGVSASDAGYTKGVSGRTSLSKEGVPSDPRFPGGQDCYVLTIDTSGRILDGFVGQDMDSGSRPESIQKASARLVFQGHTHAGALDSHHAGQTKVAVLLRDVFLAECRDEVDHFVASLSKECSIEPKTYRAVWKARYGDGGVGVFDVVVTASDSETAKVMLLDRTAVADELATTEKKLAAARAEARSSAAALADLSHEMKTPLNAVIGFADALRAETFGPVGHPRYGEYADHIHSSGQHLLDLVKSILDLARIEADRLTLSPALADPITVARECTAMVRQSAEANGLSLIVEAADDIGECALDKRAVRQILINLLSNAVKFTSDGEVRLSVDAGPAEITTFDPTNALSDQQCLVFTVKDTGIGMDRETLERLGPRYTDAQGLGVRGSDGAGIGLSLA
ncbi:MAG: HAMP domain-containing sensor histidine kinase, partial [Pseudomonadota bacterium]